MSSFDPHRMNTPGRKMILSKAKAREAWRQEAIDQITIREHHHDKTLKTFAYTVEVLNQVVATFNLCGKLSDEAFIRQQAIWFCDELRSRYIGLAEGTL